MFVGNVDFIAGVESFPYGSKGKASPLQAWAGPKGSRRLRRPDFKTIDTRRW
jgi:hypothetical protein